MSKSRLPARKQGCLQPSFTSYAEFRMIVVELQKLLEISHVLTNVNQLEMVVIHCCTLHALAVSRQVLITYILIICLALFYTSISVNLLKIFPSRVIFSKNIFSGRTQYC